jgi:hypothetical protein
VKGSFPIKEAPLAPEIRLVLASLAVVAVVTIGLWAAQTFST